MRPLGGSKREHGGALSRFVGTAAHADRAAAALAAGHPAVVAGRTLFPASVVEADAAPRVLVSGHNSAKIGARIRKGPWAGMPVVTLTLEERATCPSSCTLWRECYGNAMPFARRHATGPALIAALDRELRALATEHPGGFAVRVHVLGDFQDLDYLRAWVRWMAAIPELHVWGYTAHHRESTIGLIIDEANEFWPDRWVVRFSVAPGTRVRAHQATTIWRQPEGPVVPEGIVCPAQTNATTACATCGLCWSQEAAGKRIVFIGHGMRGRGAPGVHQEDGMATEPAADAATDPLARAMEAVRQAAREQAAAEMQAERRHAWANGYMAGQAEEKARWLARLRALATDDAIAAGAAHGAAATSSPGGPVATGGPCEPPAPSHPGGEDVAEQDSPKVPAPAEDAADAASDDDGDDTQRPDSGEEGELPAPPAGTAAEQGAGVPPVEAVPAPPTGGAAVAAEWVDWRTPEREALVRPMWEAGVATIGEMWAAVRASDGPAVPENTQNLRIWSKKRGWGARGSAAPDPAPERKSVPAAPAMAEAEEVPAASPQNAPRETPQLKRALELVAQFVHPNDVKNAVKLSAVEFALVQKAWNDKTRRAA